MLTAVRDRGRLVAGLLLFAFAACAGAQEDPLAARLVGGWRFAKLCQYERSDAGVEPCGPMASMAEWLRFEADGTATEIGPNGASGRYRIDRRELSGGRTEVLLEIGGRNMGQLGFVGDTLMLGLAYVDGPDRYFVRLPELGR
jgi:hypothetical protein